MQTNKVELVEFELTSEDDSEEKTATLPAKTATLPVFTPQVPGDALSGGAEPHKVIEPVRDTIAQISLKLLTTMVGTAQALPLPGLSRATDERLTGKADEPRNVRFYRRLRFIRRFEETLLALFDEGLLNGTTHCCIGQEADSVGVVEHLEQGDHIFSNHRCHGHYLARTGDARGLLLEIMGHAEGVCGGIGGSQHICAPGFKSNGIQGGIVPTAAGIALAEKLRQSDRVSTVFIGDGTLGEGMVYETLNLASLWKLPLWIVLENNGWSQSTPLALNFAGSMAGRFDAFNIPVPRWRPRTCSRSRPWPLRRSLSSGGSGRLECCSYTRTDCATIQRTTITALLMKSAAVTRRSRW